MEQIDQLISARWIIPIEPENAVLQNHSIAIRSGKITAVLPSAEAAAKYEAAERLERPNHVLLPGFVNAHTHAGMTLLRGLAENLESDDWLIKRIRPLEASWLDPEFVRDGVDLAVAAMITSGTTCFGEQYFYPEAVAQSVGQMHLRACIGVPITTQPTAWAESADECLDKALRFHDDYREDPLISTAFAPFSIDAVDQSVLQRLRNTADEIDLPVTMHLHEFPKEVARSTRPIETLARLGLLTPSFSGVHMTQLIESDIDLVVRHGMSVVHCPQSNLKLGNGICPVPLLVARGVNVALGTDGAASNNDLDMLDEMRTGALLAGNRLSAHQWLKIATLNGARALNLADSIGSLAPGKWADLCCIDLDDLQTQPVYDPATAVVFAASRSNVSDVWVAGRQLLASHQLTQFDAALVLTRAREWQRRISSKT